MRMGKSSGQRHEPSKAYDKGVLNTSPVGAILFALLLSSCATTEESWQDVSVWVEIAQTPGEPLTTPQRDYFGLKPFHPHHKAFYLFDSIYTIKNEDSTFTKEK